MLECNCPPDDCAEKVQAYLDGQRDAGDLLVRKFTPLVHAIVQRVLGAQHREEWEDAHQAVFLRIFAKLGQWGGRCPFCKWLAVVAVRRVIDLDRGSMPATALPLQDIADPRPTGLAPETIECIERVFADLPAEWRQAYELAVQGVAREEIAQALGKSVRTVQYRLAAVRDRLYSCLED